MKPIQTISGSWSDAANGWVSDIIALTGDAYLEVTLPHKGRLVIKKSESPDGPWPKSLITPWTGPDFRIRLLHGYAAPLREGSVSSGNTAAIGHSRYIRIITTVTPTTTQIANI